MRPPRTLPLRLWLILTVVAVAVSAVLAELALSGSMNAWQQHADDSRIAAIRRILGTRAADWRNPSWQGQAVSKLRALGVEAQIVQMFGNSSGQLAYTTPGAARLLGVSSQSQTGTTRYTVQGPVSELVPTHGALAPTFEKIVLRGSGPSHPILAVVFLWFTRPAPGSPSPWLWPLAAGGAVLAVLVVALWLFGRSVLRPLIALNRVVEGIAGGDLEVALPPSSAREVAEVGRAVEAMSAALRESLARQNQLEEERRLFIGAIAHDLRTPLFMLRGYLKGLGSGVAGTPEKRARYVEVCLAKADALERLIADLFAFTRLEYLEQEPERLPLELGALLRAAVDGVQPLAGAKGIRLALDAPDGPCPLVGDQHLLARAVENLLENALRHTPEGGQICVRWGRKDGMLSFAVEDTGAGIAPDDLPHLFTPLYRAETSRNRETGGAGLGLTIARRILRAHGGDLSAANAAGGGAVFTAILPAAQPARRTASPVGAGGS